MNDITHIGSFNVACGALRVSDPCYTPQTGTSGVLANAKNGDWDAYVIRHDYGDRGLGGVRVQEIIVMHEDCADHDPKNAESEYFDVSVDAGLAGFYDEAWWQALHANRAGKNDWYSRMCGALFFEGRGNDHFVCEHGALSNSGWGDGVYPVFCVRDAAGQVVAARIIFAGDEVDDDIREVA